MPMILAYADGRIHHCGRIARSLRPEHAIGVLSLGVDCHQAIRSALAASAISRALFIDGRLAALGGLSGTLAASDAHVWLALAGHATVHPRILYIEAIRQLREFAAVKRTLTTTVLACDAPALRFARHLGFRVEGAAAPGLVPMVLDLGSLAA